MTNAKDESRKSCLNGACRRGSKQRTPTGIYRKLGNGRAEVVDPYLVYGVCCRLPARKVKVDRAQPETGLRLYARLNRDWTQAWVKANLASAHFNTSKAKCQLNCQGSVPALRCKRYDYERVSITSQANEGPYERNGKPPAPQVCSQAGLEEHLDRLHIPTANPTA